MHYFIVQYRVTHDGRLVDMGRYRARSSGYAIAQATHTLLNHKQEFVQVVATKLED